MPKGTTTRNDLLNLFFIKTLPAYLGTLTTTGDTNLSIALHTADPGIGGTQSTSEAAYTGYARVSVLRTVAGWTVAGNTVNNTALAQFPEATAGSALVTHVSIGTTAGQLLYIGSLTSSRSITSGIQPQFNIGTLTATES
jgi:hypothetical protein